MTEQLFNQAIEQFSEPDTQEKIKKGIIDPLIRYLHVRVYVYLQFIALLLAVMILLLIVILFFQLKRS